MQKQITTILFDLDGTLIDTNELIIASFLHTLNHYYPGTYTREDVLPFIGPSLKETFSSIDPDKVDEMIERYRTHNLAHHDLLVKEFDGVYETVKTLKEKGYKLAIVSTKTSSTIKKGLRLTNLDSFFEVIIAIDDVENVKPHPEPIEKALKLLGSAPQETVMVGDNYHDILGAKNAGTLSAGVSWSAKGRAYIESYEPNYVLDNMRDLLKIVGAIDE